MWILQFVEVSECKNDVCPSSWRRFPLVTTAELHVQIGARFHVDCTNFFSFSISIYKENGLANILFLTWLNSRIDINASICAHGSVQSKRNISIYFFFSLNKFSKSLCMSCDECRFTVNTKLLALWLMQIPSRRPRAKSETLWCVEAKDRYLSTFHRISTKHLRCSESAPTHLRVLYVILTYSINP